MCPWREGDYKNASVIFLNAPAQAQMLLTEELHDGKHQTHGHSDDEGGHKGN